jgi:Leucine-rich repeat (LRR) protein
VGSLLLLTKLDLGKNKIARIEVTLTPALALALALSLALTLTTDPNPNPNQGLEPLVQLAQLSLEDNEIASLAGLGNLASLMEVYITPTLPPTLTPTLTPTRTLTLTRCTSAITG